MNDALETLGWIAIVIVIVAISALLKAGII